MDISIRAISCVKVRLGAAKNGVSPKVSRLVTSTIQYTVRNQIQRVQLNHDYITSLNQHSTLDHHEIPLNFIKSPCGWWLKHVKTTNQPLNNHWITERSFDRPMASWLDSLPSAVDGEDDALESRPMKGRDGRKGGWSNFTTVNHWLLWWLLWLLWLLMVTMVTNGYYSYYKNATNGYYGYYGEKRY
jgi:hypothetical protein